MRRLMLLVGAVAVAVVLVSAASGSAGSGQAGWVIRDLGTLGGRDSDAVAVNERGQIVGSSTTAAGETRAFVWQNGRMVGLPTLGGGRSAAVAVNAKGQAVGFSTTASGVERAVMWSRGRVVDLGTPGGKSSFAVAINGSGEIVGHRRGKGVRFYAFVWQNGRMTTLDSLPGAVFCAAAAINEGGQVVGGCEGPRAEQDPSVPSGAVPPNWSRAVLWQHGKVTNLGTMHGGKQSNADAINEHGQIVGGTQRAAGGYRVFLWRNGKMADLGTLGGINSRLVDWEWSSNAINERGQIVGFSDTKAVGGNEHAFLWQNGKMIDLGTLGRHSSIARALNEGGRVVGWSDTKAGFPNHAFVWERGKMTDLGTLPGWDESFADALNDQDQIVGKASNRSSTGGQSHAVLWTLRHGT